MKIKIICPNCGNHDIEIDIPIGDGVISIYEKKQLKEMIYNPPAKEKWGE